MPSLKSHMAKALALAIAASSACAVANELTYSGGPSTIICAVLHVCDVELQPGEVITGLNFADKGRWSISPAINMVGGQEVHHLIIRPYDVNLESSAVVTTNRRTYHLLLKSDATRYMPRVTFTYPEEAQRRLENQIEKSLNERQRGLIPGTNEYLGDLDFNYRVNGPTELRPLRVYNDQLKTTIELSPGNAAAFTALVVTEAGRSVAKSVSYAKEGSRITADSVFDAAVLIFGSGKDSATVERAQKSGSGRVGTLTPTPLLPASKPATQPAYLPAVASAAPTQPLVLLKPQNTTPPPASTAAAPVSAAPSVASAPLAQPKPATPMPPASTTPLAATTPAQPAATIPLAYKPQAPIPASWDAPAGSTLRETVETWAKREHWAVDWAPNDLDYPIRAPLHFAGSFEQAISGIFSLYRHADRPLKFDGRRAQSLLIVTEATAGQSAGVSQ